MPHTPDHKASLLNTDAQRQSMGPGWQYNHTSPRDAVIQWLREHGMWNPFSRAGQRMASQDAAGMLPKFMSTLEGQSGAEGMLPVQGQFGDFVNQWMTGQQKPMGMQQAQQWLGGVWDKDRAFWPTAGGNMPPGTDMQDPASRAAALEKYLGGNPNLDLGTIAGLSYGLSADDQMAL